MIPSVDDAFLASLLGDLDADAFNTPPTSSPKKPLSPPRPKYKTIHRPLNPLANHSRPNSAASTCSTASASSSSSLPAPRARPPPPRQQPPPPPADPKPANGPPVTVKNGLSSFWGSMDAGCKPEHPKVHPSAQKAGGMCRHPPGTRIQAATGFVAPRKAPAVVEIKLDSDQNARVVVDVKGKGRAVGCAPVGGAKGGAVAAGDVDFEALLDGMDWTDDISLEQLSPVKQKPSSRTRPVRVKAAESVSLLRARALRRWWRVELTGGMRDRRCGIASSSLAVLY